MMNEKDCSKDYRLNYILEFDTDADVVLDHIVCDVDYGNNIHISDYSIPNDQ